VEMKEQCFAPSALADVFADIDPRPDGRGYWLVAATRLTCADFACGRGTKDSFQLDQATVLWTSNLISRPDGLGYWLGAATRLACGHFSLGPLQGSPTRGTRGICHPAYWRFTETDYNRPEDGCCEARMAHHRGFQRPGYFRSDHHENPKTLLLI
jgi:hypothetical protein